MKIFRFILIMCCLTITTVVSAQTVLTGVVTDKATGEAMIGASVYVQNKDNRSLGGTMAGLDGGYRLQIPRDNDLTIVFSLIGYKTQKVKYTNQVSLNVQMEEDSYTLDDVVITAKALEKNSVGLSKREVVSATQKLSMEMLETAPVTSIEDALQGRMSNVDILSGSEPGASSSIRIRGQSSLTGSNEPLIVVDGIPYPANVSDDFEFSTANTEDFGALLNIAPSDIAEIEVLKDAAATALWGSKGANGVLLIKTKNGAKGKTQFNLSIRASYGEEKDPIPMLNASQYRGLIQEALWNRVMDLGVGSSAGAQYRTLLTDPELIGSDDPRFQQNTNWLEEIKKPSEMLETTFSMTGGGEKAVYRFSLGYMNDQKSTTKGNTFDRINTSLRVDYTFSTKLRVASSFAFTNSERNANWDSPRGHALTKMPNMSPYQINANGVRTSEYFTPESSFQGTIDVGKLDKGELSGSFNPVAVVNEAINRTSSTEGRYDFTLMYNFIPGLDYSGIAGLRLSKTKNKRFLPQSVTGVGWTEPWYNRSADRISDKMYLYTNNRLGYSKYFNEIHKVTAFIFVETEQDFSANYVSEVSGNSSTSTSDPTAGGGIAKMESGNSETRKVSFNGNFHYGFKDRYMFNLGLRSEANSAMGQNYRWGVYPTIGAGYVVSEEEFIKNLNYVSFLKLRYSWGQAGNPPTGSYAFMGTFKAITPGYLDMPAIEPNQIQLDNLKQETVEQHNIGIDAGFLDDRITFVADIYRKETFDLLQKDISIPSFSGYGKVKYYNSGQMRNEGWEFRVDGDVFRTKDWRLSLNLNVAQNFNKIIEIPDNMTDYMYEFKNGNYAYKIRTGDPTGSFYGYKYLGVYQNAEETYARDQSGNVIYDLAGKPVIMKNGPDTRVYPGDAKYQDMNGDGVIDENDIVYLGNSNPTLLGGTGFDLSFKDFRLSTLFHGRFGQKVINQARMNSENMRGRNNQSTAVMKRWRYEGDDTDIPRALFDGGFNYLGSDRFVEDASFLRLKQVTLRYLVPANFRKQLGLSKLLLFATVYDMWTWTSYSGQDPEVQLRKDSNYDGAIYEVAKDGSQTPKSMQFVFGLELTF